MIEETVINHPRLHVSIVQGVEGPQHDPYGYREIRAVTPKGKTTLHEGLCVWLKHGYKKAEATIASDALTAHTLFGMLVGFTPVQIGRIVNKLQSRCSRCGGRDFKCERGYPGESFLICVKCHHINASSMDFSAIE